MCCDITHYADRRPRFIVYNGRAGTPTCNLPLVGPHPTARNAVNGVASSSWNGYSDLVSPFSVTNKEAELTVSRRKRAVALVSGGLDSVVSLAQATEKLDVRVVIFFNYGQRALERERGAVMGVVNYYGLPWREIDIGWLAELAPAGMTQANSEDETPLDSLKAVWVPNRNGVFLNIGAAFAERYQCDVVVTGFNRDEAEEFPDNRAEYAERVNLALELSTRSGVQVMSYTQDLGKSEILELGTSLGAPLEVIWSCYRAGSLMCGTCASCRRLRAALAGIASADRPMIAFESEAS